MQFSLCELLVNKRLDQITVSELSELADINRSTFYLHYSNVRELYQELKTNLLEEYKKSLMQYSINSLTYSDQISNSEHQNEQSLLKETFSFIKKNNKYVPIILAQGYGDQILENLVSAGKEVFLQNIYANKTHFSKSEEAYYFSYVVSGIISVIRSWVESGMKESPEKMSLITIQFIY